MKELFFLLFGLVGLWLGADLGIRGAKNIAAHFRISQTFIGLTILSIGTSIPEIALAVTGGIDRAAGLETSGIVVGNVIGSAANLFTILLGLVGLFGTLQLKRKNFAREAVTLIGALLVLAVMFFDGRLTVFEGYTLIILYTLYLAQLSREENLHEKFTGRKPQLHLGKDLVNLIGGLMLIGFTSELVVQNGIMLAAAWGVTQTFVGIFVVGLGTGLPEVAVSLVALRKRQHDLSLSNLIGSNLCDLLLALGLGTAIAGFSVPRNLLIYDLPALTVITLTVLLLCKYQKTLSKTASIGLISLYVAYLGIRLSLFG
ncbi:sodium:calcium antiporter [Candidatus Woesearchaeota archaeon]|nr:MAG: sodium:calcium antiporter [Candidatus Woesearchaeota archaeon]